MGQLVVDPGPASSCRPCSFSHRCRSTSTVRAVQQGGGYGGSPALRPHGEAPGGCGQAAARA
eukprot:4950099-Pyramimonas_sp.AAC.1